MGETNLLAVRVDNSEQPSSRWYMGAGIDRHVRVVVTEPVHVAPWGVFVSTAEATAASAKVAVRVKVENAGSDGGEVTVKTTLYAAGGKVAGEGTKTVQAGGGASAEAAEEIEVGKPELWSPETPVLYRAVTEIQKGGTTVDRVETTFGIRSLEWSAGEGAAAEWQGRSSWREAARITTTVRWGRRHLTGRRSARWSCLKAAGYNAVRTAHNPPSPAFLEACDRLGLLVLDEPFDVWKGAR